MNPAELAGGSQPAEGQAQQPMPSQEQPQGAATPVDMSVALPQLRQAIAQAKDQNGYVDLQKLMQIWMNMYQQGQTQIPLLAIIKSLQENPDILDELIASSGLAGIIDNGRMISGEEMAAMAGGE